MTKSAATGVRAMQANNDAVGVISPDELYTLSAFSRRLGIKSATLRAARRAGLRVFYVHKHAYVHGRDWIDYVLKSQTHTAGEQVAHAQ